MATSASSEEAILRIDTLYQADDRGEIIAGLRKILERLLGGVPQRREDDLSELLAVYRKVMKALHGQACSSTAQRRLNDDAGWARIQCLVLTGNTNPDDVLSQTRRSLNELSVDSSTRLRFH